MKYMVSVITEIFKKELKTRFGSKKTLLSMLIPVGFPILVFIPQLQQSMSQTGSDSEFVSFLFFLIIPIMITTLIGTSTFINEIRWKTIKSLLVAPITDEEILLGKSLACILTGIMVDLIIAGIIILTVKTISISMIILMFIIGPLSVILITIIFIIGVSRFPTITEGGGAMLFPISGIMIIVFPFATLKMFIQSNTYIPYVVMVGIISILIYMTLLMAKKWFNREILVLSI